eukprot:TRINITY_DN2141_c1_g3_i1.p1 TRINITY_DN2141_c1_g3~~TRINITY_DN2141_c1_g3_i1.p1  ORF type:complete len:578 (-),score=153.52 TRINITY_DN2141_c1_g3_i1:91-1824(-)
MNLIFQGKVTRGCNWKDKQDFICSPSHLFDISGSAVDNSVYHRYFSSSSPSSSSCPSPSSLHLAAVNQSCWPLYIITSHSGDGALQTVKYIQSVDAIEASRFDECTDTLVSLSSPYKGIYIFYEGIITTTSPTSSSTSSSSSSTTTSTSTTTAASLYHDKNSKEAKKAKRLHKTESDSDSDEDVISQSLKKQKTNNFNAIIPSSKKTGRYLSKKEKDEMIAEAARVEAEAQRLFLSRQLSGKMAPFMAMPPRIEKILKFPQSEAKKGLIPHHHSCSFIGHTAGVNCVRWSNPNGQLLASASMDHTVRIWDPFRGQQCVQILRGHSEAVKDMQWNHDGTKCLTASYDKSVKLHDVETGVAIQSFRHKAYVTALAYHPGQPNLFLAGGSRAGIACWDTRSNSVIQTYQGQFGQVQSLEFIHNGRQFVSSSDITKRNSTDKGVIVWEFDSAIVASNQVYVETFTCPVVRAHPDKKHFLAQSNANYIGIFGNEYPYKLNRAKRYEGHHVAGYHVGFSISPDGSIVCSGSADGSIYFYDWQSTRIIKIIQAHTVVCMDAVYHPLVASMVATCSWDGRVSIFE